MIMHYECIMRLTNTRGVTDGTNRLLASGKVGDNIHQTIGSDGSATTQLSDQLFAGRTKEEGHDDVGVSDVGDIGALLGETPDVIPEGFTWASVCSFGDPTSC
jgi:hypothetical protein